MADSNSEDLALTDVMVVVAANDAIHWSARRSRLGRLTNRTSGLCGLRFTSSATSNHLTASVPRGSQSCVGSGTGTADFHDEGSGNTSQGDNQAPGPM